MLFYFEFKRDNAHIETTHPEIKTLLGDKECRNETAKANTEKTKKKKPTRD